MSEIATATENIGVKRNKACESIATALTDMLSTSIRTFGIRSHRVLSSHFVVSISLDTGMSDVEFEAMMYAVKTYAHIYHFDFRYRKLILYCFVN